MKPKNKMVTKKAFDEYKKADKKEDAEMIRKKMQAKKRDRK